ncbi:hypothetical protein SIID45300_01661 [Candidatus Magnetaquicoccaceae bacterium FCR-1]|uniref:DUF1640 domain-containing protein n=1 Tax=Candidatus Magnetaquiglobus chichijimensis TaxID=3141448 RepID=A0ABQ0C8Y7_9PROT
MTTIAATFDTLSYAKRFKAAGFTDSQAEEVVAALREVRDSRLEEMATKGDIKEVTIEIEKVRREIAESKADTIKWMFGVAAGQAVFIVTLLKMFPVR